MWGQRHDSIACRAAQLGLLYHQFLGPNPTCFDAGILSHQLSGFLMESAYMNPQLIILIYCLDGVQ